MDRFAVECLCCAQRRIVAVSRHAFMQVDECPRCGYLGWAPATALSERARGLIRRRPPEQRRLYAV